MSMVENDKLSEFEQELVNNEMINELEVLKQYKKITNDIIIMLTKKNSDYGDDNLLKRGLYGVIVRLDDKLSRLNNLIKQNSKSGMVGESIEDTLKDIIGYCVNSLRIINNGNKEFINKV